MNHASFTINKVELLEQLKNMATSLGRISKRTKTTIVELTITNDLLTLVIPGFILKINCETTGTAKVAIGLYYFQDIVQTFKDFNFTCNISTNEIKIGGTTVNCQTTFIETDRILRSVKLPINYTDLHILQLEKKGYTIEELEFNKLEFLVYKATKNLKKNIRNTTEILQVYGFTAKEIAELIDKKIS